MIQCHSPCQKINLKVKFASKNVLSKQNRIDLILTVEYVYFAHLFIQGHLHDQFQGQMSPNMIIQQIKLVTGVIPPISGIILIIEGHFKMQISNFKFKIQKVCF